jgi:hypothetical protein
MNIQIRDFIGHNDWGWVQQVCPILRVEDTCGMMAIDTDTNSTVGAVIMDNWTQNSVQCHFMIETPMVLRHGFLECAYNFIFNVCDVKYIYGLVPADNTKAVAFNTHMGFTVKTVLDEAFEEGVDYLIMQLKREDCKFIRLAEAA